MFAAVGLWSYDHRALVLAGCLLLLAGAVAAASTVRFDNSFEAYFDVRDETYLAYDRYRDDFGSDEVSYILYEAPGTEHGAFDLGVMRRIARLTEALEQEVPFVDEVTSLANAEYVEGVPGGLEIEDLLEEFPETQAELLEIRDKVLRKPLYVGSLVSRDGRVGALMVEMAASATDPVEEIRLDPEGGDGLDNLYPQVSHHAVEEILARPEYEGIVFHHVGDVPLNAIYNEIMAGESDALGLATITLIGLLLYFFFRRPLGVLGPLLVVATSVVVTVGAIGLLGWSLDLMFVMLPTLLIAVGVADSVHVIAEFGVQHAALGDRREAAARTLGMVGTPCLMTSLTTAVGFASMTVSPIESVARFAAYAAFGVFAAFLLTVTLLFVCLSFGRQRAARAATARELERARGGRLFQSALQGTADFVLARRTPILVVFALLFVASALGIARLRVESNFMTEFDEEEPIRVATAYVDERMGGTLSFVYLFDSAATEGVKDPELLRHLDGLQAAADAQERLVRKSSSIGDLLKDVNRSFHAEDPAWYALPETRELAGQYLLLYEMSGGEELSEFVSGDFERTSLELRCRTTETSLLREVADDLAAWLERNPPPGGSVSMTGVGALWLRLQEYITSSQINGFLLAFSVIAIFLCVVFQSVKTGLIAMVPNLSPVVLTLGVMGWADLPLDYVRLFIASVAIGISVDDTIHHLTRFRLEFRRCGRYAEALRAANAEVGRALVITSIVLVAGFLVLLLSRLDSMGLFGVLLASTIGVALLADFLLMPALVLWLEPWGPERAAAPRGLEPSSLTEGQAG